MASLAASRASLTALPVNAKGATTSATFGPTPGASSSSPARGLSSSKTSAVCSRRSPASIRARYGSGVTYSDWVSTLREDCLRRQRWVRATSASASLSSQWPTPDTMDGPHGARGVSSNKAHQSANSLDAASRAFQVPVWPTPTTRDWKGANQDQMHDRGTKGPPLNETAVLWATPCARDHMPAHTPEYIASKKAQGHGMKILT